MQLNLFVDYKPTAQLISFPADHRVTMAHAIAQALTELDYESGKKRWQLVSQQFGKGLRSEGFSAGQARTAIDDLAEEVHRSIDRLNILKQYRSPAVILSLTGVSTRASQHGESGGAARALGRGTKFLVGLGEAHEGTEFDSARAHDGGSA